MKVIVTGGAGFAGSFLVEHMVNQGHEVISVGSTETLDNQKDIYKKVDLLNADETRSKLEFKNVDIVFHLAGLAQVSDSFSKPAFYLSTNSDIQINLFEACLEQKAKPRFLIVSSGMMYDAHAQMPLTEKSNVIPNSPYAVSKLAQEVLGQYYQTRGFEVIVARAFNHIGPRQAPGFLVPDLAKQIANAEKSSNKTIKIGDLSAQRDYTDVRDIARAYSLLGEKGLPGEIYNVSSGIPVRGETILSTMLGLSKDTIKTAKDPKLLRPSDTPLLVGSPEKLKKTTGWEPQISLNQSLSDALEYWRSQV